MAKGPRATSMTGHRRAEPSEANRPRLLIRKCRVCEWQGEVIARLSDATSCPWCFGPTTLVRVVQSDTAIAGPANKNPHAAALGRLGGLKGGQARAAALTAQQRRAIAIKAAKARWKKAKKTSK